MIDWHDIANEIANRHAVVFDPNQVTSVVGGDIAGAYRCRGKPNDYFVKLLVQDELTVLTAEAEGMAALADAGAVRTPAVFGVGVSKPWAYLVMEWIDFGTRTSRVQQRLGTGLAALHRTTHDDHGWPRPNFIGANPQINQPEASWADFYWHCRLLPQLTMAESRGFAAVSARGKRLAEHCDRLLQHRPVASLLHGDLWGGNWAADAAEQPVIFDPAVYFGDRETDLAMTRLFGGFGPRFYAAYEAAWPLPDRWENRLPLYQLYHVLNHLNLFGGGYLAQAMALIDKLEASG